jgi:hypothetical protein
MYANPKEERIWRPSGPAHAEETLVFHLAPSRTTNEDLLLDFLLYRHFFVLKPNPLTMEIFGTPSAYINSLSPSSAARDPRVQLPSTTDPPGPNNPPKQLVWLVSIILCVLSVVVKC